MLSLPQFLKSWPPPRLQGLGHLLSFLRPGCYPGLRGKVATRVLSDIRAISAGLEDRALEQRELFSRLKI